MPKPATSNTCTLEGCPRETHARGLCSAHYARWRRGVNLHAQALPPLTHDAVVTHVPPVRPRCTSCGQPDRVYEWSPPVGTRTWWYCANCQWQWRTGP